MKKIFRFLLAAIFALLLSAGITLAQGVPTEKRIKLVKGRKLVFKSQIYEGDDFYYTFKAREGQVLTVRLIGRDADFTINTNDIDVAPFTRVTKFWSGKLPGDNTDEYSIKLNSNYKSARYTIEILLK